MRHTAIVTWIVVLALGACTQSKQAPSESAQPTLGRAVEESAGAGQSSATESFLLEQKLIRRAELELEVGSVDESTESLEAIAQRYRGLVADSEGVQDDAGNRRAVFTLRVPSESFATVVDEIRDLGEVQREKLSTRDVTKAYADLELRLGVKRQTEERLRGLLSSRTGDLSEVLQVERELGRIIGEIEQLLGERRFYDQRVATSDIHVDLYTPNAATPTSIVAPIRNALEDSLSVLAASVGGLIYVVSFLTPWALLGAIGWWLTSTWRRRRSSAETPDEH